MTTYLFSSMLNASDGSLMCSTLTVKGHSCAGVEAVGTLRILLALGLCANSVTAAYFSFQLSEAIQDEQEEEAKLKSAKHDKSA